MPEKDINAYVKVKATAAKNFRGKQERNTQREKKKEQQGESKSGKRRERKGTAIGKE